MEPRTRIGDADRDRATADLGRHYAEGRLDHEEYDERLDAIWSARTAADLALIFHDLPRQLPAPLAQPNRYRRHSRLPLLPILFVLIGLSIWFEAPLWLLIFPAMWFAHHRRSRSHGRPHSSSTKGAVS